MPLKNIEPAAKEGMSYRIPALKLRVRPLIGFSIAKHHMSAYPFSTAIVQSLGGGIQLFEYSNGVIGFTKDNVTPEQIIEAIMELRKQQLK